MKHLRRLLLLSLALLPAGCASPPPVVEPELGVTLPGGWTAPGDVNDGAPSNDPGWWKTFGDTGLDSVVE